MQGKATWHYRPYQPLNFAHRMTLPYICRLAPEERGAEVQIIDNGAPDAAHILKYRIMGTDHPWQEAPLDGDRGRIDGLTPYMDYELKAVRVGDEGACSALRFFRTGEYPGRIVNYVHPKDDIYAFSGRTLCNPCIVKVPSGNLITCMDIYEATAPQNLELIFRSRDGGKSWEYVTDLFPCMWGTLFMHKGVLYMLATRTENGDLLIGASYDEGETWTAPVTIYPGSGSYQRAGWQRQPMPIIEHQGKLITSIEYGCWREADIFGIHTLYIDAASDLLQPENWHISQGTHYSAEWENSPAGGRCALLEGNVYVAGDGKLVNLLRLQMNSSKPAYGYTCILQLDENNLDAAPALHSIRPMPTGANTKTYILYDAPSRKYWGIGNLVTNPKTPAMRNVPALVVSDDGYDWRVAKVLYDYSHLSADEVGMQYHHFIIEGDDILWLSRTAFNQAKNFHDSNCQTFHVIENFRSLDL